MTNTILLKRSSVQSKVPATTDLTLGELAVNTYDGKLYLKKNNGADAIVEIGPVYSVAGKTGAVTLVASDVGLGNVTNSLQVINAGNTPSISSGTFANIPTAGTAGRVYLATDINAVYRDTGSAWALMHPAITGDVSIAAGATTSTLATVNSNVGSFGSATAVPVITVNGKGLITAVSTSTITPAGIGAQPADSDLTALSNVATTGFYVITGTGTSTTRSIVANSTKLSITSGSGQTGNVGIDIVESNLDLANLSGTLDTTNGGTGLTAIGTAGQLLGVNTAGTALEYKTPTAINAGINIDTTTAGQFRIGLTSTANRVKVYTASIANQSLTGTYTLGTTAPTTSSGTQIAALAWTPASGLGNMLIRGTMTVSSSSTTAHHIGVFVFYGSTLVTQAHCYLSGATIAQTLAFQGQITGGSGTQTITVRVGASTASTTFINQINTNTMGNAGPSVIEFLEYGLI